MCNFFMGITLVYFQAHASNVICGTKCIGGGGADIIFMRVLTCFCRSL